MEHHFAIALSALLLTGYADDGVPKVRDPHNIVVDGKSMSQVDFIQKYCAGKSDNATCMTVLAARRQDATRGKKKVEW